MHTCTESADCNGGECQCGVCTTPCEDTAACSQSGSACAGPGSAYFALQCGASSMVAGICVPEQLATTPARQMDATAPAPEMDAAVAPVPEMEAGIRPVPMMDAAPPFDGAVSPPPYVPPKHDAAVPVGDAGALAACDSFSDSRFAGGPAISFRNDILPIFGLSCTVSDCHSPTDHKAGLNLGYKCAYDANAKWKCTFPVVSNPDPVQAQPDDAQTVAAIYASLLAPSATVTGPLLVQRVKPGDPANSFLVLSLADKQNMRGYSCVNQDVSHESLPPACGVSMPQNQATFCDGTLQPRFDAVVRWIAQGALNN
jgi:hypothetical protein